MQSLPYLLPYLVPIAIITDFLRGEFWPFRIVLLTFVIVVVLDLLIVRDERSASSGPSGKSNRDILGDLAFWLWLPAQAATLTCGLHAATSHPLSWSEVISVVIGVGMTGGMLSAPAAHELLHRRSRFARLIAEAQMCLLSYSHFCIEHAQGHHRRVATAEDPASARTGEGLYVFLPRAILGGAVSAWRLEADRLRRNGSRCLSAGNRMLRGLLLTAAIYAVVGFFFGPGGVLFMIAQSLIGIAIVETFNYVQHYGLSRKKLPDGRYEAPTRMHAWNSYHPVGNWFILNLGCHSDHHCNAGKSYRALGQLDHAPKLPTGLYGMCLLAFFPALWFSVMDPLAASYRADPPSGTASGPAKSGVADLPSERSSLGGPDANSPRLRPPPGSGA